MDIAYQRNRAREIETRIRGKIQAMGVCRVADVVGVHQSQVSRWQTGDNVVSKAARLLAAIGFDEPDNSLVIQGEGTAELARALIEMLEHIREPVNSPKKKKSRGATTQRDLFE
ncbi:CII family transcriptional regulator [Martelella alba]|uniref:HTH cro/C1-type domain-containing protein n=1 Tax=Martelella alba TaxID=2590451 RepID=A0ABY2SFR3_9HYPH|nr:CII family transcriptional regulator [Martelella alba]TKI03553.1 hypothetical protein FCN80_20965 [Martelella alba]